MAQKKDFDTYDDRLFLLSYNNLSLKDLVDAVTKKSGSQVKDIIQEDETCAAVIVFDEIGNIYILIVFSMCQKEVET